MRRIEVMFVGGKAKTYDCIEWSLDDDNTLMIEKDDERSVYIHPDQWISVEDF